MPTRHNPGVGIRAGPAAVRALVPAAPAAPRPGPPCRHRMLRPRPGSPRGRARATITRRLCTAQPVAGLRRV